MRDEICTFENKWGDLTGVDSLEDHRGFGALDPQFLEARTAIGAVAIHVYRYLL